MWKLKDRQIDRNNLSTKTRWTEENKWKMTVAWTIGEQLNNRRAGNSMNPTVTGTGGKIMNKTTILIAEIIMMWRLTEPVMIRTKVGDNMTRGLFLTVGRITRINMNTTVIMNEVVTVTVLHACTEESIEFTFMTRTKPSLCVSPSVDNLQTPTIDFVMKVRLTARLDSYCAPNPKTRHFVHTFDPVSAKCNAHHDGLNAGHWRYYDLHSLRTIFLLRHQGKIPSCTHGLNPGP